MRQAMWAVLVVTIGEAGTGAAVAGEDAEAAKSSPSATASADYLRHVKPILARRCQACHGVLKQSGKLRLDTAAAFLKGGSRGLAVEPGDAEASLVIDVVTAQDGLRMPPEGEPLTADEIGTLRRWIDQGAKRPDHEDEPIDPRRHWAFRPVERPEVPEVSSERRAWAFNPIDAFLAAEHATRGLTPIADADRATLLRRVSLDLTGLAPTSEELRAFLADTSADAYEKAVDRLLASPRYGERWGRHWMDIWRYSDWAGYMAEVRESQPLIWRWRDWIIQSLNEDKGYDRMVREMLAGDEIAPEDPATVRATGFLVRNWFKFNRNTWLDGTIQHTSRAFLGLSLHCARCHDHKYDPISQADYYRFRAFFEPEDIRTDPAAPAALGWPVQGVVRIYDAHADRPTHLFLRGNEAKPDTSKNLPPGVPAVLGGVPLEVKTVSLGRGARTPHLADHAVTAALAEIDKKRSQAETKAKQAREAQDKTRADIARLSAKDAIGNPALVQAIKARRHAEDDLIAAESEVKAAQAAREAHEARVAAERAAVTEPIPADAKALAQAAAETDRRSRLARAAADEYAALAALRRKIPARPADQAKHAQASVTHALARAAMDGPAPPAPPLGPTYPATSTGRRLALANWIASPRNPLTARVAVNHIWMRHFGTPLVPTESDFGLRAPKPTHAALLDWLADEFVRSGWSQKAIHRLIVTSHIYRLRSAPERPDDPAVALDAANRLYWRMNPRRMESEAVRDNLLHLAGTLDIAQGGPELDQNTGLNTARRSLYYRHAFEKQMTFLRLFDAPGLIECYRRTESVVPQQALALVNSTLARSQSRKLARTLPASEPTAFVEAAYERVLGRPPTNSERAACLEFLEDQARRLADPSKLTAFLAADSGTPTEPPSADPKVRAREDLVLVLFNLSEFVTVR